MRIRFCFALILATALPAQANDGLGASEVESLIRNAEKHTDDPRGWAFDMLDVLRDHGFDATRENICASIAVIDQESSFNANPSVPGLGRLSEKALREKLDAYLIVGGMAARFLENSPTVDDSYMLRIRNAKTERDLDLIYRSLVNDGARKAGLEQVVNLGLFNNLIDSRNEISTAGSMQVAVKFALDESNRHRFLPMSLNDTYAVRDELYTRRGGMYYGILRLLGYETGYDKKIYRFADYNAGRYASRNAAFQNATARLSGQPLAADGDLLLYKDGTAKKKASATERALRQVLPGLDPSAIRKDLLKAQGSDFVSTQTFIRLRQSYRSRFGADPAFATLPDIDLHSAKISRRMTTAGFAESVNRRYQSCMTRK